MYSNFLHSRSLKVRVGSGEHRTVKTVHTAKKSKFDEQPEQLEIRSEEYTEQLISEHEQAEHLIMSEQYEYRTGGTPHFQRTVRTLNFF